MNNPIYEVAVKATGQKIKVYKLNSGGWKDYDKMSAEFDKEKTIYQDEELIGLPKK